MTSRPQFVFGYGSLAVHRGPVPSREIRQRGFVTDLPGFIRRWGVAMDNRHDHPGYKYYTDQAGRRPVAFVAFLDLRPSPAPGATVNGVCVPVTDAELAQLDLREHNYERLDVSDRVDAGGVRVWAYVGSAAGRDRAPTRGRAGSARSTGRAGGTAVIDATYVRAVEAAFARLGEDEHRLCRASLAPAGIPVVELTRHDLP